MPNDPNLTVARLRENPRLTLWWIYHRATTRWRAAPRFLIAGVQKGGTSSLFQYLSLHPQVRAPFRKEIKYFDIHYPQGESWYQAHFPLRSRLADRLSITGEGTPNYLFHPTALQRAARSFPDLKIIILLRNPIERAYSHYQHQKRVGHEPLSFAEAVAAEPERLRGEAEKIATNDLYPQANYINHSYLASGRYIEQIPRLYDLFPSQNILILQSETFYAQTGTVYQQVLAFLGLPAWTPPVFERMKEGHYPRMDPATRSELAGYFAPFNRALYDLLQRDFGWENP